MRRSGADAPAALNERIAVRALVRTAGQAALAGIAAMTLAGCVAGQAGTLGLTTSEDGRIVAVLVLCDDALDRVVTMRDAGDGAEEVGLLVHDGRLDKGTYEVVLEAPPDDWRTTTPLEPLRADAEYETFATSEDHGWYAYGPTWKTSDLAGLRPGHVLYERAFFEGDEERFEKVAVPRREFEADACG